MFFYGLKFAARAALCTAALSALAAASEADASKPIAPEYIAGGDSAAQPKSASHGKFYIDENPVKPDGKKLKASILPSTMDGELDAWFRMPRNAVPRLTTIKKARFGEKFSLFPMIENAAVKDGKFSLKYSITAVAPDGAELEIVKNAAFGSSKNSKAAAVVCPDIIDLRFDKRYQSGRYVFRLSVSDEVSGEKTSGESAVELVAWQAPEPVKGADVLNSMFNTFHTKPSADLLYAMFFSKDLDLEDARAPYRLNFTILGFFKAGFLKYDFLIEEIMANFAKFDSADRNKIILISRAAGKPPILDSLLSPAEQSYQKSLFAAEIPNPYEEWHKTLAPVQMDMLWGEVYATGAYKPLRRIMNPLMNAKEAQFMMGVKASKKRPARRDFNKFTMGAIHVIALKSILQNAADCDLADQYCVWAIENRDLPEASLKALEPYFK